MHTFYCCQLFKKGYMLPSSVKYNFYCHYYGSSEGMLLLKLYRNGEVKKGKSVREELEENV